MKHALGRTNVFLTSACYAATLWCIFNCSKLFKLSDNLVYIFILLTLILLYVFWNILCTFFKAFDNLVKPFYYKNALMTSDTHVSKITSFYLTPLLSDVKHFSVSSLRVLKTLASALHNGIIFILLTQKLMK